MHQYSYVNIHKAEPSIVIDSYMHLHCTTLQRDGRPTGSDSFYKSTGFPCKFEVLGFGSWEDPKTRCWICRTGYTGMPVAQFPYSGSPSLTQ